MKLLFLTDNFPPEVNAPANRTYEHCREWVRAGVDVTVITGVPNFPTGKVHKGYKNKLYQTETVDGIKVIRVWTYITANEGFNKRVLDYISYGFMAFVAGIFVKTDLIVATSPQFFTAVSGSMLSFFKRKKWVMEVRDLWPESVLAVGAMERNAIINFLERVEKRLYKSADQIIVVTDTFKEKISERGISLDKISIFKNGVNLEVFKPAPKSALLLAKYHLEGKFVFAYIGTHGMAHALGFVLDAINKIKYSHPHINFLFVGDGAEKKELVKKAEELDLTNALFIDSVPKSEVVDYLNLMDVALVNLKRSEVFKTVIPSKIFEAAAVRKPILMGLQGEAAAIIDEYKAGFSFFPEDEKAFLDGVKRMALDKESYEVYQQGCILLAKDFNRKHIARALLEKLRTTAE